MPLPEGYQEIAAPFGLPRHIEAVWTSLAATRASERILPDGRCDIILRFRTAADGGISGIVGIVAGPSTAYHDVSTEPGTGFVGVRLRPGFARAVLGLPLAPLANAVLHGQDMHERFPGWEALCEPAADVEALISRLAGFVSERSARSGLWPPTRTLDIVGAIHAGAGRLTVGELAALHGVTARTVRRDVMEHTGLTPKALSQVLQFHRAVRLMRGAGLDTVSTALEAGYADQAHMTRSFRRFGGFTPARMPLVAMSDRPLGDY